MKRKRRKFSRFCNPLVKKKIKIEPKPNCILTCFIYICLQNEKKGEKDVYLIITSRRSFFKGVQVRMSSKKLAIWAANQAKKSQSSFKKSNEEDGAQIIGQPPKPASQKSLKLQKESERRLSRRTVELNSGPSSSSVKKILLNCLIIKANWLVSSLKSTLSMVYTSTNQLFSSFVVHEWWKYWSNCSFT